VDNVTPVDPKDPVRAPTVRFGPDRRLTALGAVAMVITAATAAITDDRAGRLLFAAAAVLLLGYTVSDLWLWPRLSADRVGVRVRSLLERADLPWSAIDAVRADVSTRHGLRTVTLEIDAGERLIVLSRRSLGADPERVAELVRAFEPGRGVG
jgi:hypothetical protein